MDVIFQSALIPPKHHLEDAAENSRSHTYTPNPESTLPVFSHLLGQHRQIEGTPRLSRKSQIAKEDLIVEHSALETGLMKETLSATVKEFPDGADIVSLFAQIHADDLVTHTSMEDVPLAIGASVWSSLLKDVSCVKVPATLTEALDKYQKNLTVMDEHYKQFITENRKPGSFSSYSWEKPSNSKETKNRQLGILKNLSLGIAKQVKSLSVGESYFFRGGRQVTKKSNAQLRPIVYEFIKRDDEHYDLYIYLPDREKELLRDTITKDGKTWIKPVLCYQNISDKDLFFYDGEIHSDFFETLLEVQFFKDSSKAKFSPAFILINLMKHLEKYRNKDLEKEIIISQRKSHTFAWSSLKPAVIRSLKLENYKKAIVEIKLNTMIELYRKKRDQLTKDNVQSQKLRLLLKTAASHLLKDLASLRNQGIEIPEELLMKARATALDLIDQIDRNESHIEELRKQKTQGFIFPEVPKEKIKENNQRTMGYAKKSIPKVTTRNQSIFSHPPQLLDTSDVNSLQMTLRTFLQDGKPSNVVFDTEHLVSSLPLPGTPKGEPYWQELPKGELEETISLFGIILSAYAVKLENRTIRPTSANTAYSLYAILHRLCLRHDFENRGIKPGEPHSLASYAFRFPGANDFSDDFLFFTHPDDYTRRCELIDYFGKTFEKKVEDGDEHSSSLAPILFDFNSTSQFSIDPHTLKFITEPKGIGAYLVGVVQNNLTYYTKKTLLTTAVGTLADRFGGSSVLSSEVPGMQHFALLFQATNRVFALGVKPEETFTMFGSTNKETNSDDIVTEYTCQITLSSDQNGNLNSTSVIEHFPQFSEKYQDLVSRLKWGKRVRKEDTSTQEAEVLDFTSDQKEISDNKSFLWTHCEPALFPHKLIAHYRSNLTLAESAEQQALFEIALFRPVVTEPSTAEKKPSDKNLIPYLYKRSFPLKEEIEQGAFQEEIAKFITDGLDQYFYRQPNQRPKVQETLFFIRLACHLNQFAKISVHASVFEILEKMLADKSLTAEERNAIALHQVLGYATLREPLGERQIESLLNAWIFHQNSPKDAKWKHPYVEAEAAEFIKKSKAAELLPATAYQRVMQHALEQLDQGSLPGCVEVKAEEDQEHILSVNTTETNFWKLNLITGEMKSQDGIMRLAAKPSFIERSAAFESLFGKREYLFRQTGSCYSFRSPEFGAIKCFEGWRTLRIQREIDNQLYEYQPPSYDVKLHIPKYFNDNFTHWFRIDKDSNEIILRDNKTGQNSSVVTGDGTLQDREGLHSFWQIDDLDRAIAPFEEPKFVYLEESISGEQTLHFWRFFSQSHQELTFVKDGDKTVFCANKKYCLSPNKRLGLLRGYDQYLYLTHSKEGSEKLLVPLRPFTNYDPFSVNQQINFPTRSDESIIYFEFDIKKGIVTPLTQEGTLYLAYLYLGQQKYREARQLIKKIDFRESFSNESQQILRWITSLADHGSKNQINRTPEAAAVVLHAQALGALAKVRAKEKKRNSEDFPEVSKKTINFYREHEHLIADDLVLTPEEKGALGFPSSEEAKLESFSIDKFSTWYDGKTKHPYFFILHNESAGFRKQLPKEEKTKSKIDPDDYLKNRAEIDKIFPEFDYSKYQGNLSLKQTFSTDWELLFTETPSFRKPLDLEFFAQAYTLAKKGDSDQRERLAFRLRALENSFTASYNVSDFWLALRFAIQHPNEAPELPQISHHRDPDIQKAESCENRWAFLVTIREKAERKYSFCLDIKRTTSNQDALTAVKQGYQGDASLISVLPPHLVPPKAVTETTAPLTLLPFTKEGVDQGLTVHLFLEHFSEKEQTEEARARPLAPEFDPLLDENDETITFRTRLQEDLCTYAKEGYLTLKDRKAREAYHFEDIGVLKEQLQGEVDHLDAQLINLQTVICELANKRVPSKSDILGEKEDFKQITFRQLLETFKKGDVKGFANLNSSLADGHLIEAFAEHYKLQNQSPELLVDYLSNMIGLYMTLYVERGHIARGEALCKAIEKAKEGTDKDKLTQELREEIEPIFNKVEKPQATCEAFYTERKWESQFTPVEIPETFDEGFYLSEEEKNFQDVLDAELKDFVRNDYKEGQKINKQRTLYDLSDAKKLREELKGEIKRLDHELIDLEAAVLEVANKDDPKQPSFLKEAKIRRELNMKRLVDLFLRGDKEKFAQANPYLRNNEFVESFAVAHGVSKYDNDFAIDYLYNAIGLYMTIHVHRTRLQRAEKHCAEIETCEGESLKRKTLVQKLSSELKLTDEPIYSLETHPELLVFEYLSGLTLQKDQARLLEQLLEVDEKNNYYNRVIQLIMGGGKTSVIAVILLRKAARKGRLSLFITPASQYGTVGYNLRKVLRDYFDQDMEELDLTREEMTLDMCKKIKKRLDDVKLQGDFLLTKAETLQGLELNFLHLVYEVFKAPTKATALQLEHINTLKDNLIEFRENGDALLDEVDLLLYVLHEVNYPVGDPQKIDFARIDLVREIYAIFSSESVAVDDTDARYNFKELIGLHKNRQYLLPKKTLYGIIAKAIAWNLPKKCAALQLESRPDFIPSFERYINREMSIVCQQLLEKPDETAELDLDDNQRKDLAFLQHLRTLFELGEKSDKEAAHQIALVKHLMQSVFPVAFEKIGKRNYGRGGTRSGEVRPYLAVDTPSDNYFGYHWEAICFHMQTVLQCGVSEGQLREIADVYLKLAVNSSKKEISFDKTLEALEFNELTGVGLHELNLPKKLTEATQNLNAKTDALLRFEADTAAEYVTYFPFRLTSTGQSLVCSLATARAMSGTPWNMMMQQDSLANNFEPAIGTEGQIADKSFSRIVSREPGKKYAHFISTGNAHGMLQQLLERHPQRGRVRTLLDSGALFKDATNLEVAVAMRELLGRPVLFFKRDESKGEKTPDTLHLLRLNSDDPEKVSGTRLEDIQAMGVEIDELSIFMDERHTTGIDIPMPPDAIGMMTLDETMLRRSHFQTKLRMRGYFYEQDVEYIIPDHLKTFLDQYPKITEFGDEDLEYLLGALLNDIKNQAIKKSQQFFRACKRQIDNVFRQCLLSPEVLLCEEPLTVKKIEKEFKSFVPLTLIPQEDSPYTQFGALEYEVDSIEALNLYRERKLALFADKQHIKYQEMEEETKAIVEKAKNSPYTPKKVFEAGTQDLGVHVDIEAELDQDLSRENLTEDDAEIQKELSLLKNLDHKGFRPEETWDEKKIGAFLETFNTEGEKEKEKEDVQLSTLSSLFQPDHFPYCWDFREVFSAPIRATSSWVFAANETLPIFHRLQRPLDQILIISTPQGYQAVVLSQKEAKEFKEYLHKAYSEQKHSNVWLIQSDGSLLEDNFLNTLDFENDPTLQSILVECHVFNGRIDCLEAVSDHSFIWLYQDGNSDTKKLFLKVRTQEDQTQKQLFAFSDLFNEEGMSDARKEMRKKRIAKELEGITEEQIQALTAPKDLRKLINLNSDQVNMLQQEQVDWLKPAQIPWLVKPKLIQGVKKHLSRLKRNQMEHLSETQVSWCVGVTMIQMLPVKFCPVMTKEQFAVLEPGQIMQIRDKTQFDRLSAIKLKEVIAEQVKLGLVEEKHVPYLRKPDAIAALPVDWLHLVEMPLRKRYLSREQVAAFDPEKHKDLFTDLTFAQVKWLVTPGQLAVLSQPQFDEIDASQVKKLVRTKELVERLKDNKIEFIHQDAVEFIKDTQIKFLSNVKQVRKLAHERFKHIEDKQAQVLTDEEGDFELMINWVPDRLRKIHIRPAHVARLNPEIEKHKAVIVELNEAKVPYLVNEGQLRCLRGDEEFPQYSWLKPDQITNIIRSKDLVLRLNPEKQVEHIHPEAVQHIPDGWIPHLKKIEQIRALDPTKYELITRDQAMLLKDQDFEIMLGLKKDLRIEFIREAHVRRLDPALPLHLKAIQDLTQDQVKWLVNEEQLKALKDKEEPQIEWLSPTQIEHLVRDPTLVARLIDKQIEHIDPSVVEHIKDTQVQWLGKITQVRVLKKELYPLLETRQALLLEDQDFDIFLSLRKELRVEHAIQAFVARLTPNQHADYIKELKEPKVKWLINGSQLAVLGDNQIGWLEPTQIKNLVRSEELVKRLKDGQFTHVHIDAVKFVPPEHIFELKDIDQIRQIPKEHYGKLVEDQISQLEVQDLAIIESLKGEQFDHLSKAQESWVVNPEVKKQIDYRRSVREGTDWNSKRIVLFAIKIIFGVAALGTIVAGACGVWGAYPSAPRFIVDIHNALKSSYVAYFMIAGGGFALVGLVVFALISAKRERERVARLRALET